MPRGPADLMCVTEFECHCKVNVTSSLQGNVDREQKKKVKGDRKKQPGLKALHINPLNGILPYEIISANEHKREEDKSVCVCVVP